MKKLLENRFGLVLSEVLMAVAMLMIATLVLGSIITSAISTTLLSKNYLLAHNLAVEAVESVKSIRNTNWLLEPNNKDCWLRRTPCVNKLLCPCNDSVQTGNYIVYQENGIWKFSQSIQDDLDLNSDVIPGAYQLYLRVFDSTNKQYIQIPTDDQLQANDEPTDFYRSVTFNEINLLEEYTILTVNVQWYEGKKVRSIERTIILYNYL